GPGRRPAGTGAHPVLRLGPAQPGLALAVPGADRRRRRGGPGRLDAHGDLLRAAGPAHRYAEAVHRRLGPAATDGGARRRGPALPGRRVAAGAGDRERAGPDAVVDLVPVGVVQRLPGYRLDARAVPDLP